MFAADGVDRRHASTVVAAGRRPVRRRRTCPPIAADVSYVDGVTGGNVMVISLEGARRLAAAMMGADPEAVEAGGELDELELLAPSARR